MFLSVNGVFGLTASLIMSADVGVEGGAYEVLDVNPVVADQ